MEYIYIYSTLKLDYFMFNLIFKLAHWQRYLERIMSQVHSAKIIKVWDKYYSKIVELSVMVKYITTKHILNNIIVF